jgi:hypothetical protein
LTLAGEALSDAATQPAEQARPRRREAARTCIVTRQERPPEALLRFALSPDGIVTPDLKANLPGRGAWIAPERAVLAQAIKKGAFARAFKTQAIATPDLPDLVEQLMKRDCVQSLAMANKAGLAITGFGKVESLLAAGEARVLLHAVEAGADGVRKLDQAARRAAAPAPQKIETFASAELDLAFGRTNVIHAALKYGAASEAFLARYLRLRVFRGEVTAAAPQTDADGAPPAP